MATLVDRYGPEGALLQFNDAQLAALPHAWEVWARPQQLAPGTPGASDPRSDWDTWLILAGRGFGKTRSGAEYIRHLVETGQVRRIALVGATAADVRDVMVEGESGLLAICPPDARPVYEPSKRRLTWPNGAVATCYSADEPERLRGPQHDAAWCDEIAAWRYPEAMDQLRMGLRLGARPRMVCTTTPKPVAIVRQLLQDKRTVVTRGSTYDNSSNLAAPFLSSIRAKYEGTRLGRQELNAELLDDTPGALWTRAMLDGCRVSAAPAELTRIVVAVDPAVTNTEGSDDTGIVVAGLARDRQIYVLADVSLKGSTDTWAKRAVDAFKVHDADVVVAEVNNGGDLVERVIKAADRTVAYRAVRASRGKLVRAEPVSMLYEQGRVHHVGCFPELEDQQCTFVPSLREGSPDRVDALVWAVSELMRGGPVAYFSDDDWKAPTWTF